MADEPEDSVRTLQRTLCRQNLKGRTSQRELCSKDLTSRVRQRGLHIEDSLQWGLRGFLTEAQLGCINGCSIRTQFYKKCFALKFLWWIWLSLQFGPPQVRSLNVLLTRLPIIPTTLHSNITRTHFDWIPIIRSTLKIRIEILIEDALKWLEYRRNLSNNL